MICVRINVPRQCLTSHFLLAQKVPQGWAPSILSREEAGDTRGHFPLTGVGWVDTLRTVPNGVSPALLCEAGLAFRVTVPILQGRYRPSPVRGGGVKPLEAAPPLLDRRGLVGTRPEHGCRALGLTSVRVAFIFCPPFPSSFPQGAAPERAAAGESGRKGVLSLPPSQPGDTWAANTDRLGEGEPIKVASN